MSLPWYEYGLWFSALAAKAVLFWKCLNIRKLAFLQIFTIYGLVYELLALLLYFQYPDIYFRSLWILDFIKYFIISLLITQLATLKENTVVAYNCFIILCGIITVLIFNTNLTNTDQLLRTVRFLDAGCIGIALLVFVQKMDRIHKKLTIGLSGILAGDFLCSTIQAFDHWKHWNVVRPLYAFVYLISLIVLIYLTGPEKGEDFLYVRVGEVYPLVPELVPVQQQSLSPELYLP